MYGFMAWFFKRLIQQLDALTGISTTLHTAVETMKIRMEALEREVRGYSQHD